MRVTLRLLSSVVQRRPFYVTTPIFYVNAAPHLGHLYTAVVADAIQRFEKLIDPNCKVIFSTGTDEHGTKVQQAAEKANLSLQTYCDNISQQYRDLFKQYNIEYTDFVRTTEERHKKAVAHFWEVLKSKEYIYKAQYSGWYSVSDECFVPETHITQDNINGERVQISIESGSRVEWTEETNYMFRLSAFKTHLQDWLRNNTDVITPSKYQRQLEEMLSNETYFPDISVSRPASRVHWAIRVPDDPDQSIYVWLDALINYLTVAGYPDEGAMKRTGRIWPADVQVVGKDILKFHGIYWPAFLMAVGRSPPRRVLCHAHWTVDGVKMSKSRGNVVSPADSPASHGLRYFMLREATMHGDANYSETKLLNVCNSELADTLGNLTSRCCGDSLNPRREFPALHDQLLARVAREDTAAQLIDAVERLPDTCRMLYQNYQFYKVVDSVMHTLHLANLFFETQKPWVLRKNPESQKQLDIVLHLTMETLRITGIILQPIVPDLAQKLLDKLQIGRDCRTWQHCEKPSWKMEGIIYEPTKIEGGKFVLFQRIYRDKKDVKKGNSDRKETAKKKVLA